MRSNSKAWITESNPLEPPDPDHRDARTVIAVDSHLVVGRAQQTGNGYELQFDLVDISGQRPMISETVTASGNDLRGAAHWQLLWSRAADRRFPRRFV